MSSMAGDWWWPGPGHGQCDLQYHSTQPGKLCLRGFTSILIFKQGHFVKVTSLVRIHPNKDPTLQCKIK